MVSRLALKFRIRCLPPTPPPLALQLASVPVGAGTVGVVYGGFLTEATGGQEPYTWSIVGGDIPGLSLPDAGNPRLYSGTPTTAGTFAGRKVRVVDALGAVEETDPFSIVVAAGGSTFDIVVGPTTFKAAASTTVGAYVNGDIWALGPMSVVAVLPAHATISGTMYNKSGGITTYPARATNGLQKNPGNIADAAYLASLGITNSAGGPIVDSDNIYGRTIGHGFDSLQPVGGAPLYKDALNFDPARVGALVGLNNVTLAKAVSYITAPMPYQDRDLLTDIVLLTVVSEIPPTNAFRPGQAATDKTSYWTTDDVDETRLAAFPNYPVPGGATAPDYATLLATLRKPWQYAVTDNTGGARAINAQNNQPDYGQDIGWIVGDALNLLCTNAITSEQKRQLTYALIQQGEDLRARVTGGNLGEWYGLGGGNSWPLSVAAFTCWMMEGAPGVAEFAALLDSATNSSRWSEFNQIFLIEPQYTRIIPEPFGTPPRPLSQYRPYMVGEYDWRQTSYSPGGAGFNFDATYRGVVSSYMFGLVNGLRMLGILSTLNAPQIEGYYDKYRSWIKAETASSNAIPAFHLAMYDAHRGSIYDGNPAKVGLYAKGAYVWIKADDQFAPVKPDSPVLPPSTADFVVTVNGSPVAKSGVDTFGHNAAIILSTPLVGGETVTLAYTKGTNRLKSLDGGELPSFTAAAVTNLSGPPAGFTSAQMTYNGGTARSVLKFPLDQNQGADIATGETAWIVIGVKVAFPGPVVPNGKILGVANNGPFHMRTPSETQLELTISATSRCRFRPSAANFNPKASTAAQMLWFSVDMSKLDKASGGMAAVINDIVQDVTTSEYTFNSGTVPGTFRFSLAQIFPSDIGVGAAQDGTSPANVGLEYLYIAHGKTPADKPDITDPAVRAAMATGSIGGNGQNISGRIEFGFWTFTPTDANSAGGVPNRGKQIGLPIIKQAGTWA